MALGHPGLPQSKQPQSRTQPEAQNPCAEVLLGRWQDSGHRFSRAFTCSSEPQLPTEPPTLPGGAKRGICSWLLPFREAKHLAELQDNGGKVASPCKEICLFHTLTVSPPATFAMQVNCKVRWKVWEENCHSSLSEQAWKSCSHPGWLQVKLAYPCHSKLL